MFTADVRGLTEFAAHTQEAALKTPLLVAATVKKGATNIKKSITEDLQTSKNKGFRKIRIHYDIKQTGTETEAKIAPQIDGASNLANIAFFGTARGGGTHKFYEHGEKELNNVAKYVKEAAVQAWYL